ncbi:uncharacterized protein LOC121389126 [Gigantopelta aegis]|uniref:uncharacterized protein LOC121389126 n=1 Tax=Gigantopelta aegis TaxID=1735272 RepID=UPI001B8893F4|nr:uncharacterized protein LOC121389126 [Gigantopelta aegis]
MQIQRLRTNTRKRGCSSNRNVGGRVWCSSGKSATVRIESQTQDVVDRRYKLEARLHARADCSLPMKDSSADAALSDSVLLGRLVFIGIVVGAVFGGILLSSVCCTVIYCLCLRNKNRQDTTAYISVPMQPTAPPETLRLQAMHHCDHQSPPISNPTYQQPKGSIIPIKFVPAQVKQKV